MSGKRYVTASMRWACAGRPTRTDEEVNRIFTECCSVCEYFKNGRCSHPNCRCHVRSTDGEDKSLVAIFLGRALSNKIRMATEKCPIGKWCSLPRITS